MEWFCLECFQVVEPDTRACPRCGTDLAKLDAEDFDQRLIRALDHRLGGRRLLAARALGERRCRAAVPKLIELAQASTDPYLAAEAVRALALIDDPAGWEGVRRAAREGPAISRAAAKAALDEHGTGPQR